MEFIFKKIEEWLVGLLSDGICEELEGLTETINQRIWDMASIAGQSPADYPPGIFPVVRTISQNILVPLAGIILTFIACYELITMLTEQNNMASIEIGMLIKWVMMTAISIYLITHSFEIATAIFEIAQDAIAGSINYIPTISGGLSPIAIDSVRATLETLPPGRLMAVQLQILLLRFILNLFSMLNAFIIQARIIEIHLMVALAPLPCACFLSREFRPTFMNYIKSLIALGLQGILIMICLAVYSALVANVVFTTDVVGYLWSVLGCTVLLFLTMAAAEVTAHKVLSAN